MRRLAVKADRTKARMIRSGIACAGQPRIG